MPNIIGRAKGFVRDLKSVDGALVIGSAAYGQPNSEKDIDLMIISTNISDTLTSPSLKELDKLAGLNPDSRPKHQDFSHCFKGNLNGVLWSPAIYTPQTFRDIINLYYKNINYVRNTSNSGIKIELFDFDGTRKEYAPNTSSLSSGHFLAFEPICIKDTGVYFGPAPDALLKSPVICVDKDKKIESSMINLWDNIYFIMKDYNECREWIETGRLPILSKKDSPLPEPVYQHISKELNAAKQRAEK